jgi:hypothetical protein
MPSRHVTFVLPFDDADDEDDYDSDFENSYELEEVIELDLDEEILLFKDDDPDPDSELEERTSFIDIKEYLIEIAFIEPLKLLFIKIPVLSSDRPTPILKSRALLDTRIKI